MIYKLKLTRNWRITAVRSFLGKLDAYIQEYGKNSITLLLPLRLSEMGINLPVKLAFHNIEAFSLLVECQGINFRHDVWLQDLANEFCPRAAGQLRDYITLHRI